MAQKAAHGLLALALALGHGLFQCSGPRSKHGK